jgi:hypothetical protein
MCYDIANKTDLQNIPALLDPRANGLTDADMRTLSIEATNIRFRTEIVSNMHFTTE